MISSSFAFQTLCKTGEIPHAEQAVQMYVTYIVNTLLFICTVVPLICNFEIYLCANYDGIPSFDVHVEASLLYSRRNAEMFCLLSGLGIPLPFVSLC